MSVYLGVDPGPTETAIMTYDASAKAITWFDKLSNTDLIDREFGADFICIEMIASYGMPVGKEVFETCVHIGRFIDRWSVREQVSRLTRHMVKMHICKSARANDANVRAALIDRFGGTSAIKKGGPLYKVSGDVWAALAVAITAAETTERYEP